MPRPQSASRQELVRNAMQVFWRNGFHATSVDQLVQATGVSRGGIYGEYDGKSELFNACLLAYNKKFAEPAIALLGQEGDGLSAIGAYLDYFIHLHEKHGLPGPGCFFANTMTELAAVEIDANEIVSRHSRILNHAFLGVLKRANAISPSPLVEKDLQDLSAFLVSATQGMWSYARTISKLEDLKKCKRALMVLLCARFQLPVHQAGLAGDSFS